MLRQGGVVSIPLQRLGQPTPVTDGAVVAPRRSGSWGAGPAIGALCCLGLILLLIAATIVLSLIPLYTSRRSVNPVVQQSEGLFDIPVASDSNITPGELNANQRATLQAALQNQLNNNAATSGSTVSVQSATAQQSPSSKRQARATIIRCILIFNFIGADVLRAIERVLLQYVIPLDIANAIESQAIVTTTPSTNTTRSLSRRSIEESGAPAGIVYIDIHRIAETKGFVSTVSFYADQSCTFANIEIGAFNLLNRNLGTNNAEFILIQQSKTIKLDDASKLKPYMSLITIQLCDGNTNVAQDGSPCKGTRFEVLPYQYIGIRSDTCRFGFAPTPTDRVLATTLKPIGTSDPFAKPYQSIAYAPSDYTILQSITVETTATGNAETKVDKTHKDAPRVLFIGSYPPRRCGLAKFLDDLTNSYEGSYDIIAVDEDGISPADRVYSDKVIYRLPQSDRQAYDNMAMLISSGPHDIINIQHEYGIFGGMMGEYILRFMNAVKKPIITTMHTVIPDPNAYIKSITRALCMSSNRVIVMAELGRRLLVDVYGIPESKIILLPHGVPDIPFDRSISALKTKLGLDPNVPTMTTFGLMHRNKNIQLALDAMKSVVKSVPNMMYLVIGQTHPAILKYEGEVYRNELEKNVTELGLTNNVRFINRFVDNNELLDYLGASDIYLTPYAREDQYVSGTLSWAVGLGKAVISTPYLYAKELLSDGRGFLVPFNDRESLSSTIVQVVQDHQVRNVARRQAYRYGRQMAWPHVAQDLTHIFRQILLYV